MGCSAVEARALWGAIVSTPRCAGRGARRLALGGSAAASRKRHSRRVQSECPISNGGCGRRHVEQIASWLSSARSDILGNSEPHVDSRSRGWRARRAAAGPASRTIRRRGHRIATAEKCRALCCASSANQATGSRRPRRRGGVDRVQPSWSRRAGRVVVGLGFARRRSRRRRRQHRPNGRAAPAGASCAISRRGVAGRRCCRHRFDFAGDKASGRLPAPLRRPGRSAAGARAVAPRDRVPPRRTMMPLRLSMARP